MGGPSAIDSDEAWPRLTARDRGASEAPAPRVSEETDRQEETIADWVMAQPGVDAQRSTTAAPEQWEGTVDGHSFLFRERHGAWRIELDLAPNGEVIQRFVTWGADGEMLTEPIAVEEGTVIAQGVDTQLGTGPIDHITFIVQTIREHLFAQRCAHPGALTFCPACGTRTADLR